jgi:hypothetical protein
MATTPPPSATKSAASATNDYAAPYVWGGGLGYLLLRVFLGFLLVFMGLDKFKSPTSPYTYSTDFWHNKTNSAGEVVEAGNWWKVARPVFVYGGFDNPNLLGKNIPGEKGRNFIGWIFYWFAQVLPYAMLVVGLMILVGFLNHLALFLGGGIWLSLALGQMTLPDNPTVLMLGIYVGLHAIALALAKHNRFSITRN